MSRTAVVLGGSVAGLLAARALAGPYQQVLVVERDELPETVNSEPRRGVPQGRHIHGLLAAGRRAVEALVPDFGTGLVAHGAHAGDQIQHTRFCTPQGRLRPAASGEAGYGFSRPLFESYLRARVRKTPEIRILDRTDIIAPTVTGAGRRARVDGVRVQPVDAATELHIEADLVVDATGRGSRTPRWLAELGWPTPAEESVHVDLTYTTRTFRLDRTYIDGDIFVFTGPTPSLRRGGALGLIENGVGVVTLYGLLGERPPTDLDGFREFARGLARPETYEIIKDLEPVGEAATFRFPASVRRRYDRLREFPAGLLVLGDALASVNPAYGQGMALCALQASILARLAAADPVVDARRFFRAAARVVATPWQIATGSDLAYPEVEGRRPPGMGVLNRYAQRLQAAAVRDASLTLAFGRVVNLLAPPPSLFRPDRVVRVLIGGR
jgi:2-polyprenyl-6-methoxyphenol hydroxylase-like FAD-dependent oxidoreductase